MLNGGVAELACRNRLRSRDMSGKDEEEKGKMHNCEDEDDDEVEEEDDDEEEDEEEEDADDEEMLNCVKKVKSRKASTSILEKEKRREATTNLSDDDEKEDGKKLDKKVKNKDEKRMHGGDDKMKHRKAPTATFEKEQNKKLMSSHGRDKKMQGGDHDKDKRRNTPLPLDKNKDSLKEKKSRKMFSSHSGEKMHGDDHHKDKRKSMHSHSKHLKRMGAYDYGEHKGRCSLHLFNNNVMQKNEMKKKQKIWPNDRMEKKMRIDDKYEKVGSGDRWKTKNKTAEGYNKEHKVQSGRNEKRKEQSGHNEKRKLQNGHMEKKMRIDDKEESVDRWKMKNRTTEDYNKERKVQSGHKERSNVPIAFFKLIYNNFEEFLLIPPVVARKLKDLTNCRVDLEDSEGKFSKVRLSMVDGSLAFHQGWNDFVSDHSIKLGDFLLFECTARSQFSVRVFGMDSCERVCFSVERQGGKKRKGCHALDETENVARSMNAVSVAPYDEDGYLVNGKHKENGICQIWSIGTKREIIQINDDEVPLTQAIEDTEKLKTLHVASETDCVSANTKEDPKGVASGVLCGSSVPLDKMEGTMAFGECKTNCISAVCSMGKTIRSEIIPVIDAAPLAQENDDAMELTRLSLHIEDTSMMKESEPEVATPAKCTEIQDSDEDLRRKQVGNTVELECTTAVDKCPNNSRMNTNGDVCSKHKAPGGPPSWEKWEKATASGRAALDGTGLIKPEKLVKTVDKLVGNCSSLGVNSFQQSLQGYAGRASLDSTGLIRPENRLKTDEDLRRKQDRNIVELECTTAVEKCPNNCKMNTNGSVRSKHEAPGGSPSLEEWKKATVSGRAALDGTGLIKPEKLLKTEDKLVGNCSLMGANMKLQEVLDCSKHETPGGSPCLEKFKKATVSGRAALDGTGLIKPEKLLKTEEKLVGNCSSMGVNSRERSLQGYSGRAALDGTGLIKPEKLLKSEDKLVGKCGAMRLNPVEQSLRGYAGTHSSMQQTPGKISNSGHIKQENDHFVKGKGPTVQPKTQMEPFEPMGNIACRQQMNNIHGRVDHAVARLSEYHFFRQEDRKSSHHAAPTALLPVKVEVSELDDHSVLKTNLQFCIPPTTQTWLELPTPLSNALRRKGRQDRNVVMLKDPMKRLWPIFYHENSLFVGFTRGWKPFVAANNLQTGDGCLLLKDLDEEELVYHVQFTRK